MKDSYREDIEAIRGDLKASIADLDSIKRHIVRMPTKATLVWILIVAWGLAAAGTILLGGGR